MKCWIVDDNPCYSGYSNEEYAAQVIAAPTRNQARYFAKKNWFYDIDYIDLNCKRYANGDVLAQGKTEPCEIDDQQALGSVGFMWFCNGCEEGFLAGTKCECEVNQCKD